MFDANATFEMKVRGPEGLKTVTLRFPTDQEQGDRVRKQKMVTKDLGRGASESDSTKREDASADSAFPAATQPARIATEGRTRAPHGERSGYRASHERSVLA